MRYSYFTKKKSQKTGFVILVIVLTMRWLFTTYNVMSRNVKAKKWLVTTCNGQKCFVTLYYPLIIVTSRYMLFQINAL